MCLKTVVTSVTVLDNFALLSQPIRKGQSHLASAARASFPALTTSSFDWLNGLIVRIHSQDLLKTDQMFEI